MPEKRIPKRSVGTSSPKKKSRESEEIEEVDMEEVEMEEERPKSKSGKPRLREVEEEPEEERPKSKVKREERSPSKSKNGGSRASQNRREEPEEEPEEDVEEDAPKIRAQKPKSKSPSGGGGGKKAPKKNNTSLILLVSSIVLIGIGFYILNLDPSKKVIQGPTFDPGKTWQEALKLGDAGIQGYIAWQKLRDGGGSQKDINARADEAKSLLNQAIDKGNKALNLQLCLLVGMDQETSEKWVKEYMALGESLDGFDGFLDQKKLLPANKKELVEKWNKKTGGYQDKMTPWQEKFYDMNKNTRLEKEEDF